MAAAFSGRSRGYQVGVACLFVLVVLFLVGFSAPYWFTSRSSSGGGGGEQQVPLVDAVTRTFEGLWLVCGENSQTTSCVSVAVDFDNLPVYFNVVRALETACLVLEVMAVFFCLSVNCCCTTSGRDFRILEIIAGLGGVAGFSGAMLYVAKLHPTLTVLSTFAWSLYLTAVVTAGIIVAAIIIAVYNNRSSLIQYKGTMITLSPAGNNLHSINNNNQNNRVSGIQYEAQTIVLDSGDGREDHVGYHNESFVLSEGNEYRYSTDKTGSNPRASLSQTSSNHANNGVVMMEGNDNRKYESPLEASNRYAGRYNNGIAFVEGNTYRHSPNQQQQNVDQTQTKDVGDHDPEIVSATVKDNPNESARRMSHDDTVSELGVHYNQGALFLEGFQGHESTNQRRPGEPRNRSPDVEILENDDYIYSPVFNSPKQSRMYSPSQSVAYSPNQSRVYSPSQSVFYSPNQSIILEDTISITQT